MKKVFSGYYTPSETEFAELWAQARIVVDANVLLNVYRVSGPTRDGLLNLLENVRERLWIPHQFALEYQRGRLARILEQAKHYDEAHRTLKTTLDDQFRSRTRHPFVSEKVESGLAEICQRLLEGKSEQEELLTSDPYFIKTTELFDGRVGAPYNGSELGQIYETARKRFIEKVPPGFKDLDKPEPLRYSDYVAWRQLLDFAVKNNFSIILVTDDAKEDWWRKEGTQTFGPRPELIVEFRSMCAGFFYMYSSDRFLEFSEKYIGWTADPGAISELKERRELETPVNPEKSIAADVSGVAKTTAYEPGQNEEKSAPDTPKLSGKSIEKPKGK